MMTEQRLEQTEKVEHMEGSNQTDVDWTTEDTSFWQGIDL